MILRPQAIALVLFASVFLRGDEVTLVNGDRLTGSVAKADGKTLTIKTEFLGVVTMPWDKVSAIRTQSEINVGLLTGETLQGRLETAGDTFAITAVNQRREVTRAEIAALRDAAEQRGYERLLEPGWTQLWAGAATLGLAGAQGNAETRVLSTGMNAARVTRSDKTTVYFNSIRASALLNEDSTLTAQAARGGWGYNRNLSPRVSLNTFNDYESDRFQNLDLRFVLGAGPSVAIWRSEGGRLDLLAGGAYNRESFTPAAQSGFVRNAAEAYLGDDFTYKLTAVTAMYQNLKFFSKVNDPGRFRFNLDVGANTKLAQWLTWNVALSNRYLSTPVPGKQKNDFLYTTGIGFTFAR